MGLDGGGCGENEDVRGCNHSPFRCQCGLGSRLDYSEDGDGCSGCFDLGEGQGSGGVAGYDEDVCALIEEEAGAGDGVSSDGFAGFGAVGEAGGVAEVDVMGVGDEWKEGSEDGEAAEA